jgi:hypothetical protein
MPELPPSAAFVGEGRFLQAGGSHSLVIRTVNADRLFVSAERIFTNNLVHYLNGSGYVGTGVLEEKPIAVGGSRNQPAFTRLDLEELVGREGRGPFRISARLEKGSWQQARRELTITDLGLHAKVSPAGLLVWVVSLGSLRPVEGSRVKVLSRENQELFAGDTGPDGLIRFEGQAGEKAEPPFLIAAAFGSDLSYLPLEEARLSIAGSDTGGRPYPSTPCEAFLYPERGVIRPGESIHLRAIAREAGGGLPPAGMALEWEIARPDHRPAGNHPAELSAHGTAELEWASQSYHPTGRYTVRLKVPGVGGPVLGEAAFRVEEFLPETLRVEVLADEKRFAGGSPLPVKVRAEHLFGGPAGGLKVLTRCELRAKPFTHSAWPDVAFGSSTGEVSEHRIDLEPATLDEKGEAEIRIEIPAGLKALSALQAAITASVVQVSGRASTARIARDVDPLPFYLGARQPAEPARVGERREVEALAVSPDGKLLELPSLRSKLARVSWSHLLKKDPKSGTYRWESGRVETPVSSGEVALRGGRGSFAFTPEVAGEYKLTLTAARGEGETPVETTAIIRVEGGSGESGPLDLPDRIVLTPDRAHYRAGDTARIRVQSPITGLGLLATETDRVHDARVFPLDERTTTLEVPVTADLLPHGYVTLTVLRPGLEPGSRGVPLRAYGAAALRRDPAERADAVALDAPAEARPGAELRLDLEVKTPDGGAEDAEVAVALVDAGILALTGFATPDPLEFFFSKRALGTRAADLYSLVIPEPGDLLARAPSAAGGDGDLASALNPISARRVRSVSLWRGGLRTDDCGRVSISLPAPDFDGELVAMAVAAGKSGLASASRVTRVRRPLVMDPGLPRFLASGDRFEVPVSLHNATAEEMVAAVSLSTSEELRRCGGAETKGEGAKGDELALVPAGGSSILWFSMEAVKVGAAEIAFTCRADGEEFSKRTEIPVRPAAPPITAVECLSVEPGKPASLRPKEGLLRGTLRSRLTLSSTILPSLEGSLHYLLHYPYGCLEQTSSTLIPWITLRDYLKALGSEAFTGTEIADRVEAGISRIFGMQTDSGGLALWPGGYQPYLFGTLYATSVLLEARAAGHALPERAFARLLDYLEATLSNPGEDQAGDSSTIRAYALMLLARAGRAKAGWIQTLYERREDLGEEGRAHLALAAALARVPLPGPVLEPSRSVKDPSVRRKERRDLSGFLYSRPRELCFVLSALVDLGEPREKILPVFQSLSALREGGRFRSTHEDGLFVFALGKLARLFPPPPGAVWATVSVPGEEPRRVEVKERLVLPIAPAGSGGERRGPIGIVAEGGEVFASFETRGVPLYGAAEEGQGIAVSRAFLLPDGKPRPAGPFRQGEPVVVEIRLETPRRLENVVVVDPLPAGFEIENPNLLTADGREEAESRFGLVRSEARDDRLILFAHPQGGQSRYRYVARAVTQGRFALPPIAAECMYDSSIRCVRGSGTVEVER